LSNQASRTPPAHLEIFNHFQPWKGWVEEGFQVDFLGVKVRDEFLSKTKSPARFVETQYPGLDEEYFEWIDLLDAVLAAEGKFVMVELGAGYGRWSARAAAALRQIGGPPYALVAVEGEPTHFDFLKIHFEDNNINLDNCKLLHAAVDAKGRHSLILCRQVERMVRPTNLEKGRPSGKSAEPALEIGTSILHQNTERRCEPNPATRDNIEFVA